MKQTIKAYLENQIQKDLALGRKYDETKLDECLGFITECARKHLSGAHGWIEDVQVFKWARDFYSEGKTEEVIANPAQEIKKPEAATVEKQKVNKKPEAESAQMLLF